MQFMEIKDLIIDDRERGIFRVHRSSMTSTDLFQRERELIFNRCWVYLGHESEVEKPGDYRRRTVAGRPLFFARGSDGEVRVFLNTCPHRGALICRRDEGNAEVLQCFYHAWTFNTNGELIGVPGEDAYGPGWERGELGLKEPPRVESYRGFVFVSFNPYVEDLVTYLAGAREYLDLIVDQAEEGMRVVAGSNKYTMKANWKLLVENSPRRVSPGAYSPDVSGLHKQSGNRRQRGDDGDPPARSGEGAGERALCHRDGSAERTPHRSLAPAVRRRGQGADGAGAAAAGGEVWGKSAPTGWPTPPGT